MDATFGRYVDRLIKKIGKLEEKELKQAEIIEALKAKILELKKK